MSNDTFVSSLHPCPNCNAPVANIARICQNCGAEQPASYAAAYRRYLAQQQSAAAVQAEKPAEQAEESAGQKDDAPARRQSPFRKLALRLRQQP
jgi:predicted amidophosphoribosyltransferase